MYEEGWFGGTYEVALDQPFAHGDSPSPVGFFITDPNVTNTYIILFYSRFISVLGR